jgi:2-C-methyl-D-erythritol 2,4-cyclodiphosphate synthase
LDLRVGHGIDIHRLEAGHPFWLGGIRLEHHSGAFGHSDADVLIHALCDALLGALALGDIGAHFPDTDAKYKGIDSKILLKEVYLLILGRGYKLINADCTLLLEKPKIKPYLPQMKDALCPILGIAHDALSIKATTNEGLGYVGREDGVCAHATVLIFRE